jgi:ABC-type dipeptide/oligopeptide/nickel transport system ATPase component
MIIVSHDMGVHAYMDEEVAIMYAGNIVEKGDAEDIFRDPLHPYTKILISSLIKKVRNLLRKVSQVLHQISLILHLAVDSTQDAHSQWIYVEERDRQQ